MTDEPRNFADLLGKLAPATDKLAFRYIDQNGSVLDSLTYGELLARAAAIAKMLEERSLTSERVLLIYPPGLEFITAFLGCLISGTVAVPVSPPRRNRSRGFLISISEDCHPAAVLTTSGDNQELWQSDYERSKESEGAAHEIRHWLATDQIDVSQSILKPFDSWPRASQITSESLAFIQYTSGSTSKPRGVMISHQNLLANSQIIKEAFGNDDQDIGVCWLPNYHDMGLIGGLLQSIYTRGTTSILAPASFLQQPLRWLRSISDYRATVSGGPDFAYDLCARKATPEACEGLDLSSWKLAFSGAEMVRAETLDRFTETFAPYGFNPNAFYPCYGLAEATLLVSGGNWKQEPVRCHIDAKSLSNNEAIVVAKDAPNSKSLISSGSQRSGQRFIIVNPETKVVCADRQVGEVWVQGPSVSQGYYRQPELSATLFRAHTADGDGPFLRTGDLAFIDEGELYITGRIKDLILIRGQNLYPDDIERTATKADKHFRVGLCAAFTIDVDNQEQLVIAQEIEVRVRDFDKQAAIDNVRQQVAAVHEVSVYAVVLLKAGDLPQTSSGKTQRFACRQKFLNQEWSPIAQWTYHDASDVEQSRAAEPPPTEADLSPIVNSPNRAPRYTAEQIQEWLVDRIARRLMLPKHRVQPDTPFIDLGLSSLDAVEITDETSKHLGSTLSPTAIYQHPTIADLAKYLALSTSEQVSATSNFEAASVQNEPSQIEPKSRQPLASDHSGKQDLQTHETLSKDVAQEEIAIVGVGCRFPGGVVNLSSFWDLLVNGIDAIGPVPVDRWPTMIFMTKIRSLQANSA